MLYKIRQTVTSDGFKKYFFNTVWLMGDKILQLSVGLFIAIYVARYLGPARYGILSFAISFVALFSVLGKLGLDAIIVREIVKSPENRDQILGTAFILQGIGGLLMILCIFISLPLTEANNSIRTIVLVFALGQAVQSFNIIEHYFKSQVEGKAVSIANASGILIAYGIKLFLVWTNAALIWFAWVFLAEQCIKGCILLVLYIKRCLYPWHWKLRFQMVKSLLRDAWPMIFSGIAITTYMRIDQVMIKSILGNKAVGNYAVAVNLSDVWLFITIAITQSLMPAIVKSKAVSEDLYRARILMLYRLLILIALIISVTILLTADFLVPVLYGPDYIRAVPVLKIYVWSIIFVYMNNASWQWYLAENLQHLACLRLMAGALLNIALNYFLISKAGITGAAWATVISYSVAAYLGDLFFNKTRKNFFLQTQAILSLMNLKNAFKKTNSPL